MARITHGVTEQEWRTLVIGADPDWTRESQILPEYEFASNGTHSQTQANTPHGQFDGRRLFVGHYRTRGPYAP